jgi:hypothetical protein
MPKPKPSRRSPAQPAAPVPSLGSVALPARARSATRPIYETSLRVRVSTDDVSRLDALCAHYALNQASVLRMLIKRDHDTITAPAGAK